MMSETFSKRGSDVPAASALLNSEHFAAQLAMTGGQKMHYESIVNKINPRSNRKSKRGLGTNDDAIYFQGSQNLKEREKGLPINFLD